MNILVTGANGQLGMELRDLASEYQEHTFIFTTREELNISDSDAVNLFFHQQKIDACINCAAYTAVDKAESDREEAININVNAVGYLSKACAKANAKFIHISTDYVFDGTATVPYTTDQPTNPVNFYGSTKLEGERAALENNANTLIIRTSWVYSHYGKNFVKTMLRLTAEKESIGVVCDQFGSPTYAADLAIAIMEILSAEKFIPGIYHYSNQGIINWHQFASTVNELAGHSCKVNAITTAEFPTPAKRPGYSVFDTSKIKDIYGINIPEWKESLQKCMNLLLRS